MPVRMWGGLGRGLRRPRESSGCLLSPPHLPQSIPHGQWANVKVKHPHSTLKAHSSSRWVQGCSQCASHPSYPYGTFSSIPPSIHPSPIHPPIHPSIPPCLPPTIHPSLHLSICASLHLIFIEYPLNARHFAGYWKCHSLYLPFHLFLSQEGTEAGTQGSQ